MNITTNLTWAQVNLLIQQRCFPGAQFVYGVPRGGSQVAALACLAVPGWVQVENPHDATLFVDDIRDSGKTEQNWNARFPGIPFLALVDKQGVHANWGWVQFPWEQEPERDIADSVIRMLEYIGENPNREGLKDTPARVVKSWSELFAGYRQDPAEILARNFDSGSYDEIIAVPWIEFHSTCEHHLLPFSGYAHLAYLPSSDKPRVVGLSKLARLVDCFGRRLQIQEKMTMQIADAMKEHLTPAGVAVVLQAKHSCMGCRGVRKQKAVMVTSQMRGVFRTEGPARSEFFNLVNLASKQNEI